jgi:hypothetical protein
MQLSVDGGPFMPNFSLARIMYGTNEDFRASGWMSNSAGSSPGSPNSADSANRGAESSHLSLSLGDYLHKAWAALTARR